MTREERELSWQFPYGTGDWRLIGVSYVDEAVKIVRVIIQTIFAAIGIGVFLAFAGAAYTSFFVGKPLQQLEYSIRQIRMGEFEKISVQTKIQEIQDTEGAINVLIENIYALIKQVKEEQERKRCSGDGCTSGSGLSRIFFIIHWIQLFGWKNRGAIAMQLK